MHNSRGDRLALTKEQAQAIQHYLIREEQWRDLALFMVGIDTHLRASDLLKLRVLDITDTHGHVREKLIGRQQKNKSTYEGYLSSPTREAVAHWIAFDAKESNDFLFTRLKPKLGTDGNIPISREAFANRVKAWVSAIGLDAKHYSTKTLRKSRIRPILEAAGFDYQVPQTVLNHADIRSTIHYCRVERDKAFAISRSIQFFDPLNLTNPEQE